MSELKFQSISGRDERFFRLGPSLVRRWQRTPVYFPVGHQRQRIERHEDRGHHVLGQLLFQKAAQIIRCKEKIPLGDDIGYQALLS